MAAVATASAAVAASFGFPDGERIPVELMLQAIGRIVTAVDLPVTADLESGYGDVDRTIRAAIGAGVAGAILEDAMRPIDESVAAVETAVRAGAAEGVPIVLNARTDVYLPDTGLDRVGRLDAAKSRGMTFLAGGADRIFVPGCSHPDEIGELVNCFGPGRLSLLAMPGVPNPAELQSLGVSRVSYAPTTAMGAGRAGRASATGSRVLALRARPGRRRWRRQEPQRRPACAVRSQALSVPRPRADQAID
ncbi:MAG: isocitrate lyase/phosphoenolpyruvate mutase family protein [Actinomycetota bacterium]|nr:isocitrate lyase/phosphoenolpyruvate mutase family protein [Actinomycetota bacterium]